MARLANQLVQVLVTYATRPHTWGSPWVPLGCVAFSLYTNSDDPQAFSLFTGFFVGTMFADLVRGQTRLQFAHPRSALLPGFALPHLLAVVPIAVCATVLTPAIITLTLSGDFLFMAAVASLTFALISSQYKFIHNELLAPVFPTLMVVAILMAYLFVTLPLWGSGNIAFTPAGSIALIAASWAYMAANFVRLVRLRRHETAFQASQRSTTDWRLGWLVADKSWYTKKWRLSDMWNDRIGGFHQGSRLRITRLLRHGVSPWPPELLTAGPIAFCAACAVLFIYASGQGDFPVIWRLFPLLVAFPFPAASTANLTARPPAILASDLLRPLSRQQLIDGYFAASLWAFILLWAIVNTLAVYVLWTYPGLEPSLARIPTFVLLSAALSVAMFGFMLYNLRFAINIFFLTAWFTVLPWWWFKRDTITDAPFWIISALALPLGLWATRRARLAWLNAELGIKRMC
jgi:hypothetical protein